MSRNQKRARPLARGPSVAIYDDEIVIELRAEAARLDRTLSWIVQQCVRRALPKIRAMQAPPAGSGDGRKRWR